MKTVKAAAELFTLFSKKILLIFGISLFILTAVHTFSLSLLATTGKLAFEKDLVISFLSINLLPTIAFYFLIITVMYFISKRAKIRIAEQSRIAIEKAKQEATIETLQKLTALITDQVSRPNAELQQWINNRKKMGKAPERVENASRDISRALEKLTWASYVMPYAVAEEKEQEPANDYILKSGNYWISHVPLLENKD